MREKEALIYLKERLETLKTLKHIVMLNLYYGQIDEKKAQEETVRLDKEIRELKRVLRRAREIAGEGRNE